MFNLSLTACSFHLKKANSKGGTKIYDLNAHLHITKKDGSICDFTNMSELFALFFEKYRTRIKDVTKQQSFQCEYDKNNFRETNNFIMHYVKILSGSYGSSSDIVDGNTQKVNYRKQASDIDIRPFYLMVVFPKDSKKTIVQKGLFIFQNIGPFGVKTITTELMQDFFSNEFVITLKCNTIATDLFVKKVIRRDNIIKLKMIKNIKSTDLADGIERGYGSEIREISNLRFNNSMWDKIMDKIRFVAGGKCNLFEFEQTEYDNLKVAVDIGGRIRNINLHNIENLSIIEGIPDKIKMADGHPDVTMLIEYFKKVATEYLEEMALHIA